MARIVNFLDGAESETTPTIGNIVASAIKTYADDAAYEAAESGAPAEGNLYYNETIDQIRYYNGASWITLADVETAQSFTNKTIDADLNNITNISDDEIKTGAGINVEKLHDGSVDNTEFGHLDGVTSNIQTQIDGKINTSEKGAANGVATLDGAGTVPAAQLPSYVDDVEEYADLASFPVTGETGKIYIALDTNFQYRWTGSIYVDITSKVDSVNGQTGTVSLGLVNLDDTNITPAVGEDGKAVVYNHGTGDFELAVPNVNVPNDTVVQTSVNYTVLADDDAILVTTGATTKTITLPPVATSTGKIVTIKKVDSGAGQVDIETNGGGAEPIESTDVWTGHYYLNQEGAFVSIISDGTKWNYVSLGVSEVINVVAAPFSNFSLTGGVWTDIVSFTLPPGIWRLDGYLHSSSHVSIPASAFDYQLGLGTVAGNNTTGITYVNGTQDFSVVQSQQFFTVKNFLNGEVFAAGGAGTTFYLKHWASITTSSMRLNNYKFRFQRYV
jgi:hypothetical protein